MKYYPGDIIFWTAVCFNAQSKGIVVSKSEAIKATFTEEEYNDSSHIIALWDDSNKVQQVVKAHCILIKRFKQKNLPSWF